MHDCIIYINMPSTVVNKDEYINPWLSILSVVNPCMYICIKHKVYRLRGAGYQLLNTNWPIGRRKDLKPTVACCWPIVRLSMS